MKTRKLQFEQLRNMLLYLDTCETKQENEAEDEHMGLCIGFLHAEKQITFGMAQAYFVLPIFLARRHLFLSYTKWCTVIMSSYNGT